MALTKTSVKANTAAPRAGPNQLIQDSLGWTMTSPPTSSSSTSAEDPFPR
jgi:hypothetical protein